MKLIFDQVSHRPWPLPTGPWIMAQQWHQLLFAHWPVAFEPLRKLIPAGVELETFDGRAWLGVVPFQMRGVRPRFVPPLPWLSSFPELNVRTYVTFAGKPGVWFFSLDAGNPLAVAGARLTFHLPYFHARMSCKQEGGWIEYDSVRTHAGAPQAVLRGKYRAAGNVFQAQHGTLEYFLTERYCLYSCCREQIFRDEIHHRPWPLQAAEAELADNSMAQQLGITLEGAPLLHFAEKLDVLTWPLRRI